MWEYDSLPPVLRRWLAGAALPWSARSVRRLWQTALKENGGCEHAAIAYLDRVQARQLLKDPAMSPIPQDTKVSEYV